MYFEEIFAVFTRNNYQGRILCSNREGNIDILRSQPCWRSEICLIINEKSNTQYGVQLTMEEEVIEIKNMDGKKHH